MCTSTSGFSQPGQSLSSQIVNLGALAPASGTFTETPESTVSGGPDGRIYQYNAELTNPFPEQAGTTYWLKIVALIGFPGTVPVQWGWHNRDYTITDPFAAPPGDVNLGTLSKPVCHYQDDAVTGNVTYIPNIPPPRV